MSTVVLQSSFSADFPKEGKLSIESKNDIHTKSNFVNNVEKKTLAESLHIKSDSALKESVAEEKYSTRGALRGYRPAYGRGRCFGGSTGFQQKQVEPIDIQIRGVDFLTEDLKDISYDVVRTSIMKKYNLMMRDNKTAKQYCMITYGKNNTNNKSVLLDKDEQRIVHEFRGVIVEKGTYRPVCYTFQKMKRIIPKDWKLNNCTVTETCDGSQIKLFYNKFEKKWVISTTRRINAYDSYHFSTKSFGEYFEEALKNEQKFSFANLNPECCYSLVLSHPDCRIVATHTSAHLTHVLTRNMSTLQIVDNDDIGLKKPICYNFKNKSEMLKNVSNLPYYKEGYVVRNGDCFVKVVNEKYKNIKDLRGNTCSLLVQYLRLRKSPRHYNKFLQYYPEYTQAFNDYKKSYDNMCTILYNEYVSFRIRKIIDVQYLLPWTKNALYIIHGRYLENFASIYLSTVKQILKDFEIHELKKMIESANKLPYSFSE